ncbi:hypothetical protein D9M73_141020 [compost metagenome]
MAHGRKESTLGLVGLFGLPMGFDQCSFQLLSLTDIDPAAKQSLQLPIGAIEWHGPLIGFDSAPAHVDLAIDEYRLRILQQRHVVSMHLRRLAHRQHIDIG